MIELFSTLHFSVKHGGSVAATVQQQTYCASNSEQGGGESEVPAPSVLRKGKIMEGFNEVLKKLWRNPQDDPCLIDRPAEIEIDMIPECRLFHLF